VKVVLVDMDTYIRQFKWHLYYDLSYNSDTRDWYYILWCDTTNWWAKELNWND